MSHAGNLTTILWDNVMTHTFDSYYDAHSPKAREMYWQQARDSLIAPGGWDAWWVDQCEPDNGNLLDARRQSMFATGRGIDYFNTYSLEHSTGLYKNWRTDVAGNGRSSSSVRPLPDNSGMPRPCGRQTSCVRSMRTKFRYRRPSMPVHRVYRTGRRISAGITTTGRPPIGRLPPTGSCSHAGSVRRILSGIQNTRERREGAVSESWDAKTKEILLKYDNLRYRLMPYIYSLSWKVTSESYTMMRALAFDFRTDPSINDIRDQYMFGPAFW